MESTSVSLEFSLLDLLQYTVFNLKKILIVYLTLFMFPQSEAYLEQHCLQSEKWFEKFCFEWMHTHRLFFIECNFWSSFVICDTDHEYPRCSLCTSLQRITDGSVLPRRLGLQPQWREPGQVVKKKIGKLESNQNTICQLYWICSSQEVTVDIVALTTNKNQGIINY